MLKLVNIEIANQHFIRIISYKITFNKIIMKIAKDDIEVKMGLLFDRKLILEMLLGYLGSNSAS
ncbi:MAG: hypothetical protein CMO01_32520 [Thalassobius sp.]|nr:hypothetical protein [Thalassovita sp.]